MATRKAVAREITILALDKITFRDDLYPRLKPDNAAIARYRQAVDRLPPIAVARDDNVLVDGYHGWQARKQEGVEEAEIEHLGDLSDREIIEESVRRNAAHGHQLSAADKQQLVIDHLWDAVEGDDTERNTYCANLLSVSLKTVERWTKDIRDAQLQTLQERAWVLHLTGWTQQEIADEMEVTQQTISNWITKIRQVSENCEAPGSRQVYDVWEFKQSRSDSTYFGRMPPEVVENLLWLYTEPEQVVVDPFAGGGTTILVALRMGRKVFASDLDPSDLTLPIVKHDILAGWPEEAPEQADLILLDPPYWQQAKGRYTPHKNQMGDMSLAKFMSAWEHVVALSVEHLAPTGKVAFIISPSQENWKVVDHAFEMYRACTAAGLKLARRIIVPYQTQQTNGAHIDKAREAKQLLARYRDLIVLEHA